MQNFIQFYTFSFLSIEGHAIIFITEKIDSIDQMSNIILFNNLANNVFRWYTGIGLCVLQYRIIDGN